jgi:hypothetical protein
MIRRTLWLALIALASFTAQAAEESYSSYATRYYGSASADNALLFTTGEITRFDGCMLMSPDGAVDVEGTLDGTNWSTAAVSMQDLGATSVDPVLVTAADRMYYVPGKYRFLRVRQNGATAASASLLCWKA